MTATMAPGQIRAARGNATISNIRGKQLAGLAHGKERALVRVGISGTNVLTGKDDLSEWSDEELAKGMRRDKNGGWIGKAPTIVPKKLHDELVRRTLSQGAEMMRGNYVDAVSLLGTVVRDASADNKDRLLAARMIIDRVAGKDPIQVDVSVKAKWEEAMEASVVSLGEIIDAASHEADDDEDDEEDPFA